MHTIVIEQELSAIKAKSMYRSLHALESCGGKMMLNGKIFFNFSSNDYLNLAADERVKRSGSDAIFHWGCGSTGSRLMSGNLKIHEAFEEKIAAMIGGESALVFGSGFLTNLGVLTTLAGPKDRIFFDRLVHASLIDGIKLSGAKFHRYRHNDIGHLEELLQKYHKKDTLSLIVVDSVFSMDGDKASLKELSTLSHQYGARLIVDEAHAIGVFGEHGGGLCRQKNVKPDLISGTLSKAFGGYGGFAVCGNALRELLVNKARSFIYSTALPPASMAGGISAIEIIQSEKTLGMQLLQRAEYFHALLTDKGFKTSKFQSQIIPVHIGDNRKTVDFADALYKEGLYVRAIRPPTVPPGTERLRLSVTLAHAVSDLKETANKMAAIAKKLEIL